MQVQIKYSGGSAGGFRASNNIKTLDAEKPGRSAFFCAMDVWTSGVWDLGKDLAESKRRFRGSEFGGERLLANRAAEILSTSERAWKSFGAKIQIDRIHYYISQGTPYHSSIQWRTSYLFPSITSPPSMASKSAKVFDNLKVSSHKYAFLAQQRRRSEGDQWRLTASQSRAQKISHP